MIAGEPALGCLIIWGWGVERGAIQSVRRADGSSGGMGLGAEGHEVGVVGGGEGVDGLGGGEGLVARASVLLPCAAWRMRMRWASAATQTLFQNEQAGAISGWHFGGDVQPLFYGTAKAMQPVEGDLLEFSFAEYGRCRRERIARHRSL